MSPKWEQLLQVLLLLLLLVLVLVLGLLKLWLFVLALQMLLQVLLPLLWCRQGPIHAALAAKPAQTASSSSSSSSVIGVASVCTRQYSHAPCAYLDLGSPVALAEQLGLVWCLWITTLPFVSVSYYVMVMMSCSCSCHEMDWHDEMTHILGNESGVSVIAQRVLAIVNLLLALRQLVGICLLGLCNMHCSTAMCSM